MKEAYIKKYIPLDTTFHRSLYRSFRAQPNREGGGILIGVPESQGCASEGGQQHHVTTKGRKGGGDGTERESGITWPPPLSKRSWQFATSHRIMKQHVGLWL